MMRVWKPSEDEIRSTENWGDWSKEISKFPWQYSDSETCYILEGKACVTDSNGKKICFRKGDMVRFDKGVVCTWNIMSNIRKKFIFGD